MTRTLLRADRKLVGDRVQGFVDEWSYPVSVMVDSWKDWGHKKRRSIRAVVDSVFQEFGDPEYPRSGDIIRSEALNPRVIDMGWSKLADFCMDGVDIDPVYVDLAQTQGVEQS